MEWVKEEKTSVIMWALFLLILLLGVLTGKGAGLLYAGDIIFILLLLSIVYNTLYVLIKRFLNLNSKKWKE